MDFDALMNDLDALLGDAPVAPVEVKPAKKDLPRIRVYAGGVVTTLMLKAALGIMTAAEKLAQWAESKREHHKVGDTCPHCKGKGVFLKHLTPHIAEKCYRCDGKGWLNATDIAFLDRRIRENRPVCWVVSAPAA